MAHPRNLVGQASRGHYHFQSGRGVAEDIGSAIFPILTHDSAGVFSAIGTGFFIAATGIFVTAAHVVRAVLDSSGNAIGPLGLYQFLPHGQYFIRQIHRTTHHSVADVAVGVAMPLEDNRTGALQRNSILPLTTTPPIVGSTVCTYSYPKTIVPADKPDVVHFQPGFFDGLLIEPFPHGRDKVLLPTACFHTSMVVHGGASGGPVFGPDGAVFAINSTGYDDDTISYVSCISNLLDLAIPDVVLPGFREPRKVTIRELCDEGIVISN